jgi:transcriptional regulator with XRE-family HTH domain
MQTLNVNPRFLSLLIPPHKGQCIVLFRKQLRMTQLDLSKHVNLSRSAISKMELGTVLVNERVWLYITKNVFNSINENHNLSFDEFKRLLDQVYLDSEKKGVS